MLKTIWKNKKIRWEIYGNIRNTHLSLIFSIFYIQFNICFTLNTKMNSYKWICENII